MSAKKKKDPLVIGWKEWCSLPRLGVPAIKAKIDTGAHTSALHAFDIHPFYKNDRQYVKFSIYPLQKDNNIVVICRARVIDERYVTSSSGHKERRYVIKTPLKLGNETWNIELTLSNRDPLKFRMLLGRNALRHRVMIDPGKAFQFSL